MKYLLVDTANTFARARHVARGDDLDMKLGMTLHILLSSVRRAHELFNTDRAVYCLEGRSWRKDVYAKYKRNRSEARAELTTKEQAEDKAYWEAFDDFCKFLRERSGALVLRHGQCEADDFIARWIQTHPDDEHIICSSDSDFFQLLAPNVKIFNGITKEVISLDGVVDDKGKTVIDKKTKLPKVPGDPEWILFEKCMRGDSSDNVFSAFPRVRKTQLLEAFEDRKSQGFKWNNLMLQRWVDHEGVEHQVIDDYNMNRHIIDLTQQPEEIKAVLDETIADAKAVVRNHAQSGLYFMKLCGKYGMDNIGSNVHKYMEIFN